MVPFSDCLSLDCSPVSTAPPKEVTLSQPTLQVVGPSDPRKVGSPAVYLEKAIHNPTFYPLFSHRPMVVSVFITNLTCLPSLVHGVLWERGLGVVLLKWSVLSVSPGHKKWFAFMNTRGTSSQMCLHPRCASALFVHAPPLPGMTPPSWAFGESSFTIQLEQRFLWSVILYPQVFPPPCNNSIFFLQESKLSYVALTKFLKMIILSFFF